jgi:hypothetical protein
LEQARSAHGGDGLKNLRSVYIWQAQATSNNASAFRLYMDLTQPSILQQRHIGFEDSLYEVDEERLLTPSNHGRWYGTRLEVEPLGDNQIGDMKEELYGGVLLLAQLDRIEKAELGQGLSVLGKAAKTISLSIGGLNTTLALDDSGKLLAQYFSPTRRWVFQGYRSEGGILWPSQAELQFQRGTSWAFGRAMALLEASPNPASLNLSLKPTPRQTHELYGIGWNEIETGIEIARVAPDSPAARAGVRVGDRVLRVNGFDKEKISGFMMAVLIGSTLRAELEVRRGDQTLKLVMERK